MSTPSFWKVGLSGGSTLMTSVGLGPDGAGAMTMGSPGTGRQQAAKRNAIPEAKMGWILFAANHAARYHGLDGGFQFTLDTGGVS